MRVVNIAPPNSAPPSETAPNDFHYAVRTDDFAAVNAYYNCDRLFRMIEEMGFNVNDYFDGTRFPVPVDHRFPYQNAQGVLTGNVVNATAPGNASRNGSDGFRFALVQQNTPVGMAAEWRVVLHEFGHAILWTTSIRRTSGSPTVLAIVWQRSSTTRIPALRIVD